MASNLCCVLNPFIICEGCSRNYCYEDWFDPIKNFPDHELAYDGWRSYFACGNKKVNNRENRSPYTLKEEPNG